MPFDFQESEFTTSDNPQSADLVRSKSRSLHQRLKKILSGRHVSKEVFESLAVSNAVELFKLVFLSTSRALEVPNLLAENLRRYSEHDLFSAFSHLREKKTIVSLVLKLITFFLQFHFFFYLPIFTFFYPKESNFICVNPCFFLSDCPAPPTSSSVFCSIVQLILFL